MPKIRAILLPLVLAACGDSPPKPEIALSSEYALPTIEPSPGPAPIVPQAPDHRYDERDGWTYYYIAALSDEDRKLGRAAAGVSAFQYLGQNSEGEHILASLNDDGTVSYRAKCAAVCKIIATDYGRKIAFSPDSLIGAAFSDAFNGKLKIADWARDQIVPVSAPPPKPTAELETPPLTNLTDTRSESEQIETPPPAAVIETGPPTTD